MVDDCLEVVSIGCRAEIIPCTGSVDEFSNSHRLENNLQCVVYHAMTFSGGIVMLCTSGLVDVMFAQRLTAGIGDSKKAYHVQRDSSRGRSLICTIALLLLVVG